MICSSENINYICMCTDRYGVATYRQGDAYTPSVPFFCKHNLNVSNMEQEEWRPVIGYEGLYEVSNMGRVRTVSRYIVYKNGRIDYHRKSIIKQGMNKGYLYVTLCKDGFIRTKSVHRLVAETFIPNILNKPCIDHINTIKNDNRVENLRWVTHKENMNNGITKMKIKGRNNKTAAIKMKRTRIKNGYTKMVYQFLFDGTLIAEYYGVSEASKKTGIPSSNISKCCNTCESNYTARGFLWSYNKEIEPYINPKLKYYHRIKMYDKYGTFISEFENINAASKEMNINSKGIQKCCSGHSKTYMGYIWRYADKV